MKVMKTKSGSFGRFMRKNGIYMVLTLVVLATCVAVYAGSGKIRRSLLSENNSDINSGGDDENCSSEKVAWQTDAQQPSSRQPSQQEQSSSQSERSDSQNSSVIQSGSAPSQQMLFILPVNGDVINKFSGGKPVKNKTMGDWRVHSGIDIAADEGTSVRASGEGTVTKIYNDGMWGTTVEIEHPNGLVTIYSSLSEKVPVEKGQGVESGQAIATVGNTAKIEKSEVSHLHFAVKRGEEYLDPASVITKKF